VTLTSRDPTARLEALEELSETEDTSYLLESVIEALAGERDAKVLEGLVDIVRDRGPIPAGPLRALVTSDRDGSARAQALELLVEHAGDDQGTRTLLRTLSRNDPSEHVRDTAGMLLDDLQTPRPRRAR
jgi:HEAT repeat protein